MSKRKVLLFVGDEGCGWCKVFKPEWAKISHDKQLQKYFLIDEIVSDSSKGKRQPGCIQVRGFPSILMIDLDEYERTFKVDNGKNDRECIDPSRKMKYMEFAPKGADGRTAAAVKEWAMKSLL